MAVATAIMAATTAAGMAAGDAGAAASVGAGAVAGVGDSDGVGAASGARLGAGAGPGIALATIRTGLDTTVIPATASPTATMEITPVQTMARWTTITAITTRDPWLLTIPAL